MPGTFSLAHNIGAHLKPLGGIVAQNSAAATVVGTGIDVSGYRSLYATCNVGATTGSPTALSCIFSFEESDTVGGTYTALNDEDGNAITLTVTAASSFNEMLAKLQVNKAFVLVQCIVSFTAGTSPTIDFSATMCGAGEQDSDNL